MFLSTMHQKRLQVWGKPKRWNLDYGTGIQDQESRVIEFDNDNRQKPLPIKKYRKKEMLLFVLLILKIKRE